MAEKPSKDPFTGVKYMSMTACERAVERLHGVQLDSLNVSARQVIFNSRNRLELGNQTGKSVFSGRPTAWNEKAGRYERFADEAERERYRQMFLDRMRRVHGKEHLLDDPDQQRAMLANRSISGKYTFEDGTIKTYTGQEELALLKFLNEALNWPGQDIHCPAPQNFQYTDADGRVRFYIPDVYMESLNLIVEVKGPIHNGFRTRDIAIEHTKDAVLETSGYAYIKTEDRDYGDLMDVIARTKLRLDGIE